MAGLVFRIMKTILFMSLRGVRLWRMTKQSPGTRWHKGVRWDCFATLAMTWVNEERLAMTWRGARNDTKKRNDIEQKARNDKKEVVYGRLELFRLVVIQKQT